MGAAYWLSNFASYGLQIAAVLAAGGAVLFLIRRHIPQTRMRCWQFLLFASLALPLLEPWQLAPDGVSTSAFPGSAVYANRSVRASTLPWPQIEAGILIGGTALRLAWFALGLLRLRAYRRRSSPSSLIAPLPVSAEIRVSNEIPGPVTFGFLRPVILLPARWAHSESILFHELIHVRRHDWLCMAIEELTRAVLWFHPLVWYAIAQIQLAREEAVDREVVQLTHSREQYLETLLAIAAVHSGLDLAPAPLFLKKRHLKKRVASLMKEVTMSKIRFQTTLAGFLAVTAVAGVLAVRAFPLQAAAAEAQDSQQPARIRIGGNVQSLKLVKKVNPLYPAEAKQARIQGVVRLAVVIDKDGKVKDIEVLDGHPLLVEAAVPAVRQWEYSTTLLNGEPVEVATQVDVSFTLTK